MSEESGLSPTVIAALSGTALGALLGVLGNVLTEWLKRTWFSGKIETFFNNDLNVDFVARVSQDGSGQISSVWVRVLVKNIKKKAVARRCRAYLTDMNWRTKAGKERQMPVGDSLPLIWSNNSDETAAIDIPFGVNQFVDIIAVYAGLSSEAKPQTTPNKFVVPWFDGQEIFFTVLISTENRNPFEKRGRIFKLANSAWHAVEISEV